MRHFVQRPLEPANQVPIMSKAMIGGERFVFLKWPEGQWLAELGAFDPEVVLIPEDAT